MSWTRNYKEGVSTFFFRSRRPWASIDAGGMREKEGKDKEYLDKSLQKTKILNDLNDESTFDCKRHHGRKQELSRSVVARRKTIVLPKWWEFGPDHLGERDEPLRIRHITLYIASTRSFITCQDGDDETVNILRSCKISPGSCMSLTKFSCIKREGGSSPSLDHRKPPKEEDMALDRRSNERQGGRLPNSFVHCYSFSSSALFLIVFSISGQLRKMSIMAQWMGSVWQLLEK